MEGEKALSETWRWLLRDEVPSTQDLAIEAAQRGEPGRLAVLALRQTEGRGSRGRRWEGQAGNLFLSLLLRPEPPLPPGLYALLAGVALHEALSPYAAGLMLKWPNDLLLDGAKLGGVLIDAAAGGGWFVIGLGANLAVAPAIEGRATAALPPPPPDPKAVAEAVTAGLDRFSTAGAIRAAWLARAHGLGSLLDIAVARGRVSGRFAGITEDGALLLEGHPHPITSGEVFLGLTQG